MAKVRLQDMQLSLAEGSKPERLGTTQSEVDKRLREALLDIARMAEVEYESIDPENGEDPSVVISMDKNFLDRRERGRLLIKPKEGYQLATFKHGGWCNFSTNGTRRGFFAMASGDATTMYSFFLNSGVSE